VKWRSSFALPRGWGKITVLEEIRALLGTSARSDITMGDGSSDLPVMMHVNITMINNCRFCGNDIPQGSSADSAERQRQEVLVPSVERSLRGSARHAAACLLARFALREGTRRARTCFTIPGIGAPGYRGPGASLITGF